MKGREMDDPEQKSFQLEGDDEHFGISLCSSFWNFRSRNLSAAEPHIRQEDNPHMFDIVRRRNF